MKRKRKDDHEKSSGSSSDETTHEEEEEEEEDASNSASPKKKRAKKNNDHKQEYPSMLIPGNRYKLVNFNTQHVTIAEKVLEMTIDYYDVMDVHAVVFSCKYLYDALYDKLLDKRAYKIQLYQNKKIYHCLKCMISCKSMQGFAKHINSTHNEESCYDAILPHRCNDSNCLKRFNSKVGLIRHNKSIHKEEKSEIIMDIERNSSLGYCQLCQKSLQPSSKSFVGHVNKYHKNEPIFDAILPFKCNICNNRYFKKQSLAAHGSVHRSEKDDMVVTWETNNFSKKNVEIYIDEVSRCYNRLRTISWEVLVKSMPDLQKIWERKADKVWSKHTLEERRNIENGVLIGLENIYSRIRQIERPLCRFFAYVADVEGVAVNKLTTAALYSKKKIKGFVQLLDKFTTVKQRSFRTCKNIITHFKFTHRSLLLLDGYGEHSDMIVEIDNFLRDEARKFEDKDKGKESTEVELVSSPAELKKRLEKVKRMMKKLDEMKISIIDGIDIAQEDIKTMDNIVKRMSETVSSVVDNSVINVKIPMCVVPALKLNNEIIDVE
eukprot:TRINITY_DN9336_c0_g1_i1.p1 TRINITY_DN9336_c0_g1~~TRINITY_DN9336_c0_g1_i1.p1  ORF type:complete len:548 (-),score=92.47 TRINITY_DN9336_c0_g1_i1:8-1651(-)